MVSGGGAFGKWIGQEGGVHVIGVSALIGDWEELPWPFCPVRL